MGDNWFELKVESKLENLGRISEFIVETMKLQGIKNSRDIYAVQLAVDEASTNIIKHAYSDKINGQIFIRCMLNELESEFIVNIVDWGNSFNPNSIPRPDIATGLNARKEGGLGIYFMEKFMDIVKYDFNNGVNRLIMIKHLKTNKNR